MIKTVVNLDESCPRQLSLEAVLKLYLFYWFHLTDFDCYITNSYENPCLRTGSFMFVTYADEHLFHAMVYYIHVPLIILLYYVGTGPLHDKSNLRRASRLGSTFFSFQMYDWVQCSLQYINRCMGNFELRNINGTYFYKPMQLLYCKTISRLYMYNHTGNFHL